MTTEQKWRIFWASWVGAFVVAESVALKSHHPHAPLSHHMRKHTHLLGKTPIGRLALLAGANWLHRHLYRPLIVEARTNSHN
jgi:hypothetical protein